MGEMDGDSQPAGEPRPSPGPDERPSPGPGQDSLQVPTTKRRRIKSPTPGSIRGRSMTPIRGRSQTPFSLYLTRRSATPSTWRSITPFLKREDKEKTPFELGKDIKQQLFCNKAVFDKALIMDITEPEVEPVRYITTDMSVIDRAAVMDISNVEVIYVVEEYEEYEEYTEEEERESSAPPEEEKKKKKKSKKSKEEREKTPKRKVEKEKKEKKEKREKSPSPKLSLKLEIGGGAKASKKMFEQQAAAAPPPPPPEKKKPPPKKAKSKLAEEMEKQAKEAAKAAEEAQKKESTKPKRETYEERQKRLKAEAEEKKRQEEEERKKREAKEAEERKKREAKEAELRKKREEEAKRRKIMEKLAQEAKQAKNTGTEDKYANMTQEEKIEQMMAEEDSGEEEDEDREGGSEEEDDDRSEVESGDEDASYRTDQEYSEAVTPSVQDDSKAEEDRRGSATSEESFIRPDPEEEEKWRKIAEEEGEAFMQNLRKFSKEQSKNKSEKERDADWQKNREQARRPAFINFLTDRAAEVGQSVRIACAVSGPDLSAKWFKDSKQIVPDPRHRINNNNNILSLEVLNTTTADSGEYSCVIANVNGEVTSSCFMTIYEVFKDEPSPPTISHIRDFYHLHDDELTIECHIHGIPRPKVTWIKDNFEIKPNFKFTILEEAHGVYKLMIYRPSAKDSGKYICRAINDSGQEEVAHTVEFVKPKTSHVHFLHKEKEEAAKRAMEEALKSKEDSEKKKMPRIRQVDEPPVAPKNKLTFATQLRDRIALEGATVKLMCNVIGPDPAVRWLKDDKPLPLGPKVRNLSQENKAVVELTGVTTESSGVYKCIAKNPFSEIDTQCYLKVYSSKTEGDEQDPMFVLPMRDVYHSSENDLIIDTKVRGNPRPTITWLKDEIPVVLDARVQQIEHLDGVCELIINKPVKQDSGNYSCIAENSLGTQKITHKVVVENLPVARRSSGNQLSMTEEKEQPQQKAKKAEPSEEESKDQKGKPPTKGKKKIEDGGEGGGRRRHAIPEPSPKEKLYFIAHLTNRYLAEGSKVKLQAVVGGPDPQIKWLKNDGIVPYGPRIRNMSRESLAILEITNANVDDSGEYTVVARNPANEISTSALLHIYQPKVSADLEPMFTRALKDAYRLNTNELILETHVRGQPDPTITWFKDSVEIERGEKYQIIDHPDGTCELIVDKPVSSDTGKYVCKAENRAGATEISHYVLFESKDAKIAENIHGVFHADKSLLRSKEKKESEEEAGKPDEKKEEEGKGKGKKPKPKGAKAEPAETTKDVKPAKEEKREKRVGIYFGAKLTDRVVAEGSKVKLTCYVEGKNPQIRWLKDDQPLVYSPKVRQNYREGLCTLELLNASESDSGNYKCYAKDESGEATTICKINVYASPGTADVPPTFTRAVKDTYNGKINELVLNCHVRGLPTPTVSWVKDGVRIEPSEKYQLIEHADGTCELVINDPIPYDSGKYVCQAENRMDKAEITHMVLVEAKNLRQSSPAREIAAKKEEQTVKEGGENAEKKEEKKEEKKKEKGKKPAGEISGGRRSTAPPPDPKKKIYFGNMLSNRITAEGTNVRMSAYINGPDPQVRWFKNDQQIVYGPKSKSSCQDGLAVLVLSNLTESDSGEYKLVARNTENEITTSCYLTVYKVKKEDGTAPVFTVGIKDTYFLGEDELVLDCRVRGNPRPQIEWIKDNETIVSGDKYQQFDQADGYCKLVINNPTERDSGVYTCRAENAVQAEKISHSVYFPGRERFIIEKTHGFFHRDVNKPHFSNQLGNHIVTTGGTIAIQAEFAPTNSPIDVQWLKNKGPIVSAPNVRTFEDHGVYTLAIENATPDFAGTYTCRASNAFGKIESNANVHIIGATMKGGKPALFLSRPENEMKIAVNDPFSISFRVQGEPKPKLILMKGTKDITKSDRVSKEAQEDYIRFTVHNAQISDSGTYFVVARNEHSTDRIFVTVTIKNPKKKN